MSPPHDRDGFLGVHQDGVAGPGLDKRDADLLLALAGVHHGQLVAEQPQHGDLDGGVGAGDAHIAVALRNSAGPGGHSALRGTPPDPRWPGTPHRLKAPFLRHGALALPHRPDTMGSHCSALPRAGHANTPGLRVPGCSRNTCTSSHSTWYMVTCISLTTLGSSDSATSTWSATGLPAISRPLRPVSAIVSRPSSLAVASPASTLPQR